MKPKTYKNFEVEARQYQSILQRYKKTKEVFVDPHFHPQKHIFERLFKFSSYEYTFVRIDKYFKAPLFKKDAISPDFIKQGELGDCYLVSSLCRVAKQPELIRDLFDTATPDLIMGPVQDSINIECGAVVIYFYVFGRPTPVLIDTLIPFFRGKRIPRFVRPSQLTASPWHCLVEKAFAKLIGSYSDLDGGLFEDAIYRLFGYFPNNTNLNVLMKPEKSNKMSPFDRMMKYQRQGAVMSASFKNEENVSKEQALEMGIVENHAYVIQKVRKVGDLEFLCLRNPWGNHEWLGDWSDASPLWTPEIKTELNFKPSNDGTFWMCYKDFAKYFTSIGISRPITDGYFCRSFNWNFIPNDAGKGGEKKDIYQFKLQKSLPPNTKVKIKIIIEKQSKLFDESTHILYKSPMYALIIRDVNGYNTYIMTYNVQGGIHVASYTMRSPASTINISFDRCVICPFYEDLYIKIICKENFTLCNSKTPDTLIPEAPINGVVFDNFSLRHPEVALPLIKKMINDKEIRTFGDPNDAYNVDNADTSSSTGGLTKSSIARKTATEAQKEKKATQEIAKIQNDLSALEQKLDEKNQELEKLLQDYESSDESSQGLPDRTNSIDELEKEKSLLLQEIADITESNEIEEARRKALERKKADLKKRKEEEKKRLKEEEEKRKKEELRRKAEAEAQRKEEKLRQERKLKKDVAQSKAEPEDRRRKEPSVKPSKEEPEDRRRKEPSVKPSKEEPGDRRRKEPSVKPSKEEPGNRRRKEPSVKPSKEEPEDRRRKEPSVKPSKEEPEDRRHKEPVIKSPQTEPEPKSAADEPERRRRKRESEPKGSTEGPDSGRRKEEDVVKPFKDGERRLEEVSIKHKGDERRKMIEQRRKREEVTFEKKDTIHDATSATIDLTQRLRHVRKAKTMD